VKKQVKPAATPTQDPLSGSTPSHEPYITVSEAADFLGIPTNTCYKLALNRTLPSYKAGKLRRFKRSELAAWMESKRVDSNPAQ
jgi:excisionase family DNA binding protein